MGKGKNKGGEERRDTTMWMVTFGDLLMLLLTFFVMLLTMSSMDTKTLNSVFSVFEGGVGVMEFSDLSSIEAVDKRSDLVNLKAPDLSVLAALNNRLDKLLASGKSKEITSQRLLADLLDGQGDSRGTASLSSLGNLLDVSEDQRGVVLSIEAEVLFDSGKVSVRPDMFPLLDTIAKVIKGISNDVLVMGHTDNVPVQRGAKHSNWELSLYRALNVHRYLVENRHVSANRVFAGGYGDVRAKYPNDTKEGRKKNRRVEVILKKA